MTTTGPLDVHCTNCGGDQTLTIMIGVLSVLIALAALYTARRLYSMSRDEHQVFMKQLSARADLKPTLSIIRPPEIGDDGVLVEPHASVSGAALQFGLTSVGDKPAEHIYLNLLVPTTATDPKWADEKGHPLPDPDRKFGPNTTTEELVAKDDSRHKSHYLVRHQRRLGTESWVGWVQFSFAVPPAGRDLVIPVKLKAWCEDMRDGVEDRVVQIEFRVRRPQRG